jgi:hypothetical protein
MVVGFTTTCAISAYHHCSCEFDSRSGEVYSIQHYIFYKSQSEGGDPINRFNSTKYLCLSQDWFPKSYVVDFLYWIVRGERPRGDSSFCWYLWNCWPSKLKLSFHKKVSLSSMLKHWILYNPFSEKWEGYLWIGLGS